MANAAEQTWSLAGRTDVEAAEIERAGADAFVTSARLQARFQHAQWCCSCDSAVSCEALEKKTC